MELFFEVNNQKMERIDIENPVNSSQEYLKLSFDFKTDDWEDTTKFIFFRVHHINYSYPLTDDSIIVPAVFLNSKHLDFGVYGVGGEDYRITTNSLRIKFRESKFWSLSDAPLSVTDLINKLFEEKADLTYVDIELADKVDKVDGKELSSNDFTDEYLNLIETHQENINDLSVNKVDKVTGKELSSNDFTNYYKNFLDGFDGDIEAFLLEHKEEIEALITEEVLVTKADKSYVDTELEKKANITYVDSELSERDTEINLKSDKSYVDSELDKKANITYVDTELGKKANTSHTHTKNDITDFTHNHDERYYTESEIDAQLTVKSDKTYVDTELDKKANIADIPTKTSQLTNDVPFLTEHQSLENYYLKSEVDELIHKLNNKFSINSTNDTIQTNDTTDIYAHILKNGMPIIQKKIHFFEKLEPSITLSASQSIIEIDDNAEIYARVKDADGSLATDTKVNFYRSIYAEVYDKGDGNYYLTSNYLTQTVEEDGVLITDAHYDTASEGPWYRVSLPFNVLPPEETDWSKLCVFSTNNDYCIELDIIDSTDTSQTIELRPYSQGAELHKQTLSELSNNASFHLKIEVINGVSYWYVDNNPTPVYMEDSIDLGDAFAFRLALHKQQSMKFDNLIIYKIK